jgi:hypothetical protein
MFVPKKQARLSQFFPRQRYNFQVGEDFYLAIDLIVPAYYYKEI